jgi:hypothetical protein
MGLMMATEVCPRDNGVSTATGHRSAQKCKGQADSALGIIDADLEGLLGWKDMAKQSLFVDLESMSHILDKPFALSQ